MNNGKLRDEAWIRHLIADHASAICAKDIERIMAYYAPDAVMFDVKPPFQTQGADAADQDFLFTAIRHGRRPLRRVLDDRGDAMTRCDETI